MSSPKPLPELSRFVIGSLLGCLWYIVLLIPEFSRREVLGGSGRPWAYWALIFVVVGSFLCYALMPVLIRQGVFGIFLVGLAAPIVGGYLAGMMVFCLEAVLGVPRDGEAGTISSLVVSVAGGAVYWVPRTLYVALKETGAVVFPAGVVWALTIRSVGRCLEREGTQVETSHHPY